MRKLSYSGRVSPLFNFSHVLVVVLFVVCSTSPPIFALSFEQHNISERNELEGINHILVTDLDHDDDPDIVCCFREHAREVFGPGRISWFENDGDWTEHTLLEDAYWAQGSAVADIDQDGDLDVFAVVNNTFIEGDENFGPGRLYLFENQGDEEFRTVVIDDNFRGAYRIGIADMDDDDDFDIIGTSKYSNAIGEFHGGLYIWENEGEGEFERREIIPSRAGQGLPDFKIVDLDQDGLLDIVTAYHWHWTIVWLFNNGDFEFEQNQIEEFEELIEIPRSVDALDIDGDDDIDLVVGGAGNDVAWYENDGEQNFAKRLVALGRGGSGTTVVADIDGDDRADIISQSRRSDRISWWSNEGDGIFNFHRVVEEYRSPRSMGVGDINGDGLPDIVAGSSSGELVWFEQTDGEEQFLDSYALPIDNFWSMISMPFVPAVPDIEEIFQPLIENENMIIMKDHEGHFFVPGMFNNIPDYEVSQGYKIKLHRADTLVVEGHDVEDFRRLRLPEGWSMAAYFPSEAQDAPQAFRFISELGLILAKDDRGGFYYPDLGFNNMRDLRRNKGYKIKLESEGVAGWNYDIRRPPAVDDDMREPRRELSHFSQPTVTDNNMSVLIRADFVPNEGSEIGVFGSLEYCAGGTVLEGEGPWGVALWGDDISTDHVDGLQEGEAFTLILWDGNEEKTTAAIWIEGDGTYHTDEIAVVNLTNSDPTPNSFSIISVSPNPFNSTTTIRYSLDGKNSFKLRLFDAIGRRVATLVSGQARSGSFEFNLDGSDLSSGTYFIQLDSGKMRITREVQILK